MGRQIREKDFREFGIHHNLQSPQKFTGEIFAFTRISPIPPSLIVQYWDIYDIAGDPKEELMAVKLTTDTDKDKVYQDGGKNSIRRFGVIYIPMAIGENFHGSALIGTNEGMTMYINQLQLTPDPTS